MKTPVSSDFHVLIVGAGVSGLMAGALLERAGMSYEIFEKSKDIKGVGSALTLASSLVLIFHQLGVYDELLSIFKPFNSLDLRKEDLTPIGSFRPPDNMNVERYGYDVGIVARPDLAKLLATLVPKEKIHFNTKIISTSQDDDHVELTSADDKVYKGSILIGADGAYSHTRRTMFQHLADKGELPKSDGEPLGYGFDCVVGWMTMTLTGNRVGWMITQDVRSQNGANGERNSKFSDWGPDAALEMCNTVRDFGSPAGGTMGDMFDNTPKEAISKVMLEDKLATRYAILSIGISDMALWTVAHGLTQFSAYIDQMLPFGGQGANMAMLGALDLVNLLYDMESNTQEEITSVFERYQKSRGTISKTAVSSSNQTADLMHGKGIIADVLRYIALHWMPNWVIRLGSDKYNEYRNQAVFLPFVPRRGAYNYKSNKPSAKAVFAQTEAHAM
ncbi:hypothetical protein BG004_000859 [Podila humilis]|nr:hypothetical protein BG004_000859 [Podila humilis]